MSNGDFNFFGSKLDVFKTKIITQPYSFDLTNCHNSQRDSSNWLRDPYVFLIWIVDWYQNIRLIVILHDYIIPIFNITLIIINIFIINIYNKHDMW